MIDPLAIRTQTSGEQERGFPASEVERATGSKTLSGNQLELQYEGSSTFSLWLEGISRAKSMVCLLYTSPSPRDGLLSRMPSSA